MIETDLVLRGASTALSVRDVRPMQVTAPRFESRTTKVVWEFWQITQSQYHYKHTEEIDLGDLDAS